MEVALDNNITSHPRPVSCSYIHKYWPSQAKFPSNTEDIVAEFPPDQDISISNVAPNGWEVPTSKLDSPTPTALLNEISLSQTPTGPFSFANDWYQMEEVKKTDLTTLSSRHPAPFETNQTLLCEPEMWTSWWPFAIQTNLDTSLGPRLCNHEDTTNGSMLYKTISQSSKYLVLTGKHCHLLQL